MTLSRSAAPHSSRAIIATAALLVCLTIPPFASAQTAPPRPSTPPPATRESLATSRARVSSALKGRTVEAIRVTGNVVTPTSTILNVVRTREGDRFDPQTVEDDYQRIYDLRKFKQVEAKVEPTATGVIVVFSVSEQRQINTIAYRGNYNIDTKKLQDAVDIRKGEAIDNFRIALAREQIERLYHEKNYPLAHVTVDTDRLNSAGELVFNVVEGPNVRVRKLAFPGAHSFSPGKLRDQVHTKFWIWIFRPGTLNFDTLDDDVAALRRFYEGKGFFDVRVGRRVDWSPDQRQVQVNYVIDEGPRYVVDRVIFRNASVRIPASASSTTATTIADEPLRLSDQQLRNGLKLTEGRYFDRELVDRDVNRIRDDYSPFGYIYQEPSADPRSDNPDYLHINPRQVFHSQPGKVELVYDISEGKPFHLGRILVKGNARTQDKVVLREMRIAPGQLYNSTEVAKARDRLRGTPYFNNVTMTPVGDDPDSRDLLVDVTENKTASFNIGAGINSNGGVGGNITYEQRNFDIANPPRSLSDILSDRSFTGAGQRFRVSLEPGTQFSSASVLFSEPYLFDQPYSFTEEAYYRDLLRFHYQETRVGNRVTLGHRFDYNNSLALTLRGEDVSIHNIEDDPLRATEILKYQGHSQISSVILGYRYDSTNRGFFPSEGQTFNLSDEQAGALGGNFQFNKLFSSYDKYFTLGEDLLDRKTILSLHADAGYIFAGAPFFERFYAGGIGSLRGFRFRGVSPRAGIDDDAIGGDFIFTSSAEISFPLVGDVLRYVVFTDVGDVEDRLTVGQIRSSIGTGIRLILPFLGQTPLAVDFAYPLSRSSQDETQLISFSFGFAQ